MSRHVRPEKWADAFAGKLDTRVVEDMESHADDCASCAKARERVQSASASFPALRAQSSPDLPWDTIRARVHWSVSKERREKLRKPSRTPWLIAGALAAGGLAIYVAREPLSSPKPVVAPVAHHEAPAHVPAPVVGVVSRLAGQVMIDGVRRDDAFERTLAAGTVLATGDGHIDVQFGADSAFALGPRSTLELRHFDGDLIELAVQGTVDITVAPRAPHQRFLVVSGDTTVEVRGTQFRVHNDGKSTDVACRHGRVVVRDTKGETEVATARKLSAGKVAALTVDELDELAAATPATLPVWTDAQSLVQTSSPLEIATVGKRAVRVDGVELGEAPLRVRVMPGRHTVETADSAGHFRRSGWVDVAADKAARLVVQAEAAPTGGTADRRRQLHAGIDHDRLAQCTRAITKAGLTAYVNIELSVDETGAVEFLNIIDTDLASNTSACVREVLADVRFKSGAAATFRDKIDL
jgi:hypothetical protein